MSDNHYSVRINGNELGHNLVFDLKAPFDNIRQKLRKHEIYDGEVLSHSLESKEYGYLLKINDTEIQFIHPEHIVEFDGTPACV